MLARRVPALSRVDLVGILLATSVLLWIPSHILTLAIRYAADYERAGVPAWPAVYGPEPTRLFIAATNLLNTLVLRSTAVLLHVNRATLLMLLAMSIALFSLSAWQLISPCERRNWLLFKAASLYMLASSLLISLGAIL